MKAAAIIAVLGIAFIVTMGPSPASAQTTVVRECGGQYTVTHYNSDGSVKGVHNKQLSDEGTIYTAGNTWKLVEGDPDRFVSAGGAQLQVLPCDATRGAGVRQVQGTQSSTTLVSNTGLTGATSVVTNTQLAQAFTTGTNSLGYKLTSVKVRLKRSGTVSNLSVSIHADSSGVPGTKLGTPVLSGSLALTFANVDFLASGDGIDLDANTTYWLVLSDAVFVQAGTQSKNGESGAAGWSIADGRRNGPPPWSSTSTFSLVIAVVGSAKTQTGTETGPLVESQYPHQSPFRSTLYDHYVSQCTHMRSVSDPYRDYSLFNADGRRIQARNGWKWVEVQSAAGDVTGTRPMTISECASNALYQRQAFCSNEDLRDRNGHIWADLCPDLRTW